MSRSPRGRRLAPTLLVAPFLMWALSAHAQSAAERETARQLMDKGDEQVERGNLESALEFYQGAHEIMHVPTTGIEVARTYNSLGKLVEARDTALEVLRMPVGANEPRPFVEAREAATQLATELEGLVPVVSFEIVPSSLVDSILLTIDGAPVSKATLNLPHALNPSAHHIHLSARGYRDVDRDITLDRQEHRVIRIVMESLPSAPMSSLPTSAGQKPGTAPARILPSSRSEKPSAWVWPMWAGVGLGGAGIVVGSIAGAISLERTSSAKQHCNGNICNPEARADRDAALDAAWVSNLGFAVGAVGALVAVGSWWMSTRDATRPRVGLVFSPLHEGGTVSLRGEGF